MGKRHIPARRLLQAVTALSLTVTFAIGHGVAAEPLPGSPSAATAAEWMIAPMVQQAHMQIDEPSGDIRDDLVNRDDDLPYADAGMVGPRSYESPQYGVTVEWTRDWELDEDFGPAVESDPKTEQDTLLLLWTAEWSAWIGIFIFDSYSVAIPDFVDYYAENIAFGDDAEVVLADTTSVRGGVVTIVEERGQADTLIYDEIRYGLDRESLVVTRLVSLDANVTDGVIRAARNDISIDGEPALDFLDPDVVGDLHEGEDEEPDSPTLDRAPGAVTTSLAARSAPRSRTTLPPMRTMRAAFPECRKQLSLAVFLSPV